MTRRTLLTTGLTTLAMLGGTLALSGPIQAATTPAAVTAAPCKKLASASSDTIRLWYCNGTQGTVKGYHAQAFLNAGRTVTLRTVTGYDARTKKATHTGVVARWYNTATWWEGQPGQVKACSGTCTRLAS